MTATQHTSQPRPLASCLECGEDFVQTRGDRKFCSQRCANAEGNRYISLGNAIARDAVAWRKAPRSRRAAKAALARMAARVDDFIDDEEDRAART